MNYLQLIRELESQILALPFVEKVRILQLLLYDFINTRSLPDRTPNTTTQRIHNGKPILPLTLEPLTDAEFEVLADQLADE